LTAQLRILLSHYHAMLDHHGREPGMRLARKHLSWYSKGLPGSAEFRSEVNRTDTVEGVLDLIARFYEPLIARGVRASATGDAELLAA